MPALKRDVRRLPLRGADLVLLARHPRWKGVGRDHNTMLVVECDGPIDPDRITRAWDRFLDVCPCQRLGYAVRFRGASFTGRRARARP